MEGANRTLFLIISMMFIAIDANPSTYDVHWLGGGTVIERDIPSNKKSLDIYCYPGTSKSILSIWQTVKFNIKIQNDDFRQYIAPTPDEVYKDYTEDSYGWSVVTPFNKRKWRSVSVDLFNTTCMAINTKLRHSIELMVLRVDIWRLVPMLIGIGLIFASRSLSSNPVFFYLCGIFIGVSASFMVLVYYVSKLLPKKPLMYGALIGGWTVGVYILQQMWDNMRSILLSYQQHLVWYTAVVGFVSFLVCYRIGPPRDQRSQNIVTWTLQLVGALAILFSSCYQEAAAAVAVAALTARHFPKSLVYRISGILRRRFPPKPRLLTDEEYFEQGARETKHALDDLRAYCGSPDCAQWRVMLKLNDSQRFASFVEGDSHLSDEEIMDYEAYAFSLSRTRSRKRADARDPNGPNGPNGPSGPNGPGGPNGMEISDDDEMSSDSDED